MSRYAHYNDVYKKLLVLTRALNGPHEAEVFERAGLTVSKSQAAAWRVGRNHKHFRPIPEDAVLAYADGLIDWVDNG